MKQQRSSFSDDVLRKLARLVPMGEEDRAAVLAWPLTISHAARGQNVEDRSTKHCRAVISGFAALYKQTSAGRRQLCAIYLPGDLVDLHRIGAQPEQADLIALSPLKLAVISIEAIRSAASARPAIAEALWASVLLDAAIGREWLLNVGQRDAQARTAHLLCELSVRMAAFQFGTLTNFDLPLTQHQLGSALGLTSVHVNRTLRLLQGDGLIHYGTRNVSILDSMRLRDVGQFDPTYLEALTRQL